MKVEDAKQESLCSSIVLRIIFEALHSLICGPLLIKTAHVVKTFPSLHKPSCCYIFAGSIKRTTPFM